MNEQKILELEADGWEAVADRDQEVEALERALADAMAELEDARLTILGKDMLIGELQQRVKELEKDLNQWRAAGQAQKEAIEFGMSRR